MFWKFWKFEIWKFLLRIYQHSQTHTDTCKFLLKVFLSAFDLFYGTGDKGAKDVHIKFFSWQIPSWCIAIMLFSLDQMLLFIEIYVTLLFPNFKVIFFQCCVVVTSLWLYYTIPRLSKSSHFLFIYPYRYIILLGRQEWVLSIVQNHWTTYQVYSRLIKNIPASFRLRYLKIADITVFLLFFIQNLLSCCGDIEKNPGPKCSSLTFYHWNFTHWTYCSWLH